LPELPEVESLVRGLQSDLVGKRFTDIVFYRSDIREPIPKAQLRKILVNQKITQVTRRGKYILVGTSEGFFGIHLGMSGRLAKASSRETLAPHTHAIFKVDSTEEYRFVDPRRFGRLFAVENNQLKTHQFLVNLGLEPLENEDHLAHLLYNRSRNKTQAVKNFLMDSSIVVGVGNIYASETLWLARIHPETRSNALSHESYVELSHAVVKVLSQAIAAGGTTFRDYRDKDGNPGYFQNNLAVYGRNSKPCKRCSTIICRAVHGGRSTFYCPFCQKKKVRQTRKNSHKVSEPIK